MNSESRDWLALAVRLRERRAIAQKELDVAKAEEADQAARLAAWEAARGLVNAVAAGVQKAAHARLAALATEALNTIFDEPYELEINFVERRGKTEADLLLTRNGNSISPMDAAGGGVIDIVAFALRLTCLALTSHTRAQILILDEPFRFVSKEYRPRLRDLLTGLSERLGVQIIMVTHIPELVCGKVIEIQ